MGTGSGDLWDLAEEYLDACQVALTDTPAGPPTYAFVDSGPPPWDCEMLAVYVGGPVIGDTFPLVPMLSPGHRQAVQGAVNLISLTATVLRCAPPIGQSGKAPTAVQKNAVSQQTNADLWAIWNHLGHSKRTGALFAPREREFFLDPAVSLNQAGGFCGWQITIRTQLDGYIPGS